MDIHVTADLPSESIVPYHGRITDAKCYECELELVKLKQKIKIKIPLLTDKKTVREITAIDNVHYNPKAVYSSKVSLTFSSVNLMPTILANEWWLDIIS